MKFKDLSRYFGGQYMRYWYVAFAVVMFWFVLNMVNNSSVHRYQLTAYDSAGNVLGQQEVSAESMTSPERLPITKAYEPVKPIKFLN